MCMLLINFSKVLLYIHVGLNTDLCPGVPSRCFHCSCAAYCMAAYGMIRAIVAELPLHKLDRPSSLRLFNKNRIAPLTEYLFSEET